MSRAATAPYPAAARMSRTPVRTAAHPKGAAVAEWIDVDTWLRRREGWTRPLQMRVVPRRPAAPPPDRFVELLERLDQVAAEHKRSRRDRRGGHYSGRRRALISDQTLAREFYDLCLVEGVAPIRKALELSRQSLQDVWAAHGWKAPGRVTQPRGARAGGMAS
jgi:hypothetical protein